LIAGGAVVDAVVVFGECTQAFAEGNAVAVLGAF